jgi:hypothetical protein
LKSIALHENSTASSVRSDTIFYSRVASDLNSFFRLSAIHILPL